jgi:NADH:ubiquinone oxidoreductase subunit 3 (subunit A)
MSNIQVIILIIVAIIMVLAIWNLVLSIQNMINEKKFNKYKQCIKENDKEIEEKKDYYGRLK